MNFSSVTSVQQAGRTSEVTEPGGSDITLTVGSCALGITYLHNKEGGGEVMEWLQLSSFKERSGSINSQLVNSPSNEQSPPEGLVPLSILPSSRRCLHIFPLPCCFGTHFPFPGFHTGLNLVSSAGTLGEKGPCPWGSSQLADTFCSRGLS